MLPGEGLSTDFVDRFLNTGIASATLPEVASRQLNETFRAGAEFFRADIQEKMMSQLPSDTGYRPYGVEYSQIASRPDEMESFSVSHRLPDNEQPLRFASAECLRRKMLGLFDLLEPMVEDLTNCIASRSTDSPLRKKLHGSFRNWSLLQLNYSRPTSTDADYINELHEDGCLLTVMTVTGPGLELRSSNGSFVPMQPIGELLFISGEILNLLSGGRIPTIYHRVRTSPSLVERMSLLFFADMNPDYCTPWILNEVNVGVNIGARVLKNSTRYGLKEWTSDPHGPV